MIKRHYRIDILRGIAVLLVLGRHMPVQLPTEAHPWSLPLQIWMRIGWTGVDLFFVISGFLVSGLLFDEYKRRGKIDLMRFFVRRAIRIYVPFYAFLVPSLLFRLGNLDAPRIAVEVLFLQSYLGKWAIWNHTWTLAIEEHFYFLLGLLLFWTSHSKKGVRAFGRLIPICFLVAIACLFLRILTPYDDRWVMQASHMRFDSLFFGVFISYLYRFHYVGFQRWVHKLRFLISLAAALALWPVLFLEPGSEPWMTRFGFSCLYLSFGGILSLCLLEKPKIAADHNWLFRNLIFIGSISYSAYLWHMPAGDIWRPHAIALLSPLMTWVHVGLYLITALAMGAAWYHFVEKPSLAWRDRKFPARG
jgi:peptidoglycan/LPS O-acetylase OafA/YrhL